MKKFLQNIFSIDTKSTNRVIIKICGIKIRFLKKGIMEEGLKYTQLDCPVTEIPPTTGSLRVIQMADLKMLQILHGLCEKHGLQYWIDFGNLLGAVRHKGFIPWDDDVDVSMMRDDYEKFIELYKDGFPEYPDLYMYFDNNGKNKCFVKILHKTLPYVQIDIFPYDYYYRKVTVEEQTEITNEIKKSRNKKYYKLLYPFFVNAPNAMRKRFVKLRDKVILKGNIVDKSMYPALFYGVDYPHMHKNHVFAYEDIFPLSTILYENIQLPCPNNPEAVVRHIFGDTYMELPDNCYPRHTNSSGFSDELSAAMDKFINS